VRLFSFARVWCRRIWLLNCEGLGVSDDIGVWEVEGGQGGEGRERNGTGEGVWENSEGEGRCWRMRWWCGRVMEMLR
jgi:hypothetical protein